MNINREEVDTYVRLPLLTLWQLRPVHTGIVRTEIELFDIEPYHPRIFVKHPR